MVWCFKGTTEKRQDTIIWVIATFAIEICGGVGRDETKNLVREKWSNIIC